MATAEPHRPCSALPEAPVRIVGFHAGSSGARPVPHLRRMRSLQDMTLGSEPGLRSPLSEALASSLPRAASFSTDTASVRAAAAAATTSGRSRSDSECSAGSAEAGGASDRVQGARAAGEADCATREGVGAGAGGTGRAAPLPPGADQPDTDVATVLDHFAPAQAPFTPGRRCASPIDIPGALARRQQPQRARRVVHWV